VKKRILLSIEYVDLRGKDEDEKLHSIIMSQKGIHRSLYIGKEKQGRLL
jgi:hypothetical protein